MDQRVQPAVSIVVIVYNMAREAPRTLFSLSPAYQRGAAEEDYEVLVVENGSTQPLSAEQVAGFGANFRYFYLEAGSPSPAKAVNLGVGHARGELVGLMVDGARLVTPGVVKYALLGLRSYADPVVSTLSFHLGHEPQTVSVAKGYTKDREDALLAGCRWTENGYRLFEISCLGGSSVGGYFMPLAESNCFFLRRRAFEAIGGFDERFDLPGGGLVNLDAYKRAWERPGATGVVALGEGSFHQLHGGVSSNVSRAKNRELWAQFAEQYRQIRGEHFKEPEAWPECIGHTPPESLAFLRYSAARAGKRGEAPIGVREGIKRLLRRVWR